MYINQLSLTNFRNFPSFNILPAKGLNYFIGPNASGKTSLIESIFLIGHGRSFKDRHLDNLICFDESNFTVFLKLFNTTGEQKLGISKFLNKSLEIKINEEKIRQVSVLAQSLPLLVISPESFKFFTSGSLERRQFIDWGVFHVKHHYSQLWQSFNKVLKQRNAALKEADRQVCLGWDEQFVNLGEKISLLRIEYWKLFIPILESLLKEFLPFELIDIKLKKGWNEDLSLNDALTKSFISDSFRGFTQVGPHRADIEIYYKGIPAIQILSRGQQKLFICALYLAAGQLLKQISKKECIYLIDDISAELDTYNQSKLIEAINNQTEQAFITAIDESNIKQINSSLSYNIITI